LSQVQSDLASLAGTVSSLASTVNGLGSQIDTAVANGLSDIQADIDAIEAAVADVASSEEVSALQDAVDASQEDLDELLASSSVFTGTVTVNSTATLNAFHAMKSSLAIVNGSVDIDVSTDMDIVKVQELVDAILTVTGGFDYRAAASSIAEVTFNNLSGTQTLTLKQAGGYQLQSLASATNVVLDDAFESKVTKIDFRELTTVNKFTTGITTAQANTISFNKATELHLTKLPRYAQNDLTIVTDEGAALPISALDDVNASGEQTDLTLSITGPASVTLTKITDGTITLEDVETVSITDFTGTLDVNGGVETLTVVDGVIVDVAGASDLVTANIDLKLDDDPDLTAAQIAALDYGANGDLDFTGLTDLENVTISGQVNDITLSGNTNLETLTISAKADDLIISGASDLVSVTVTGAQFNDVSITDNTDLETLTLDHTTRLTKTGTAATAVEKGASLTVTGNSKLSSLTSSADHIDYLKVQNNAKLATINFEGLTDGGTSTTATVLIGGATATKNNLSASLITDSYDTGTTDTGAFTSTSGMKTLKTYLDAVVAKPSTTGIKVYFDSADSHVVKGATVASDSETTSLIIGASSTVTGRLAVVNVTPDSTSGRTTVQAITAVFPVKRTSLGSDTALAATDDITLTKESGVTYTFDISVLNTADTTFDTVDELIALMNGSTNLPGVTVEADRDAFHESVYTIAYTSSDGIAETTSSTSGKIYFTYGTDPETGEALAGQTAALGAVASAGIADAIATKLNALTHAYHATATSDAKILVTALVSGTLNEDYSPLPHSTNTLVILATSNSTTKALAGDLSTYTDGSVSSAVSNVTAVASSLFNLSVSKADYSGMRVTLKNSSTSIALNNMAVSTGATSGAFAANYYYSYDTAPTADHAGNYRTLTAATQIAAASITSSALDYVASFSNIESPTTTDGADTDRTGWL